MDFRHIDLEARAHRRGEADLADVLALGAGGLRLDDCIDERVEVGAQRFVREAHLADAAMNDAGLLDAEFDLAGAIWAEPAWCLTAGLIRSMLVPQSLLSAEKSY